MEKSEDPRLHYVLDKIKELKIRFPVAELSEKMGVSKGTVSDVLKEVRGISDGFFRKFCQAYGLDGVIKPSAPGDPSNRERALIKVLLQRVAKLESERLGVPVEKVLDEFEQDTMIAWRDLENQRKG